MSVQMNFRIDEDVKRGMENVAAAIGTTPAAAFNIFARQFVAVGGFPFDVRVPQNVRIPEIDRSKLYKPERVEGGSPLLPNEWHDEGGDIYDTIA